MAAPRFRLARISDMRVKTQKQQDVARLLLLIAMLHLYCRDGIDLIREYRRWRNRASAFFDACLSGEIVPAFNKFQDDLNALMPKSNTAHLYLPEWGSSEAAYYASLIRGKDGLWRLRHRRLRPVPGTPARDGVLILWGDATPSPDIVVAQTPTLERVLTGGVSCADFGSEAETCFEVRRQLSHAVIVAHIFDALHHDRLATLHNPGKVDLHVNTDIGDGWVHPYEFVTVAVRPYALARTHKARVVVWGNASDAGLYALQVPRCILPAVKGASIYQGNPKDRTEIRFLSEVLLSRLFPLVGILRLDQRVDVYGLHYDVDRKCGVVAEFAAGLPLRSCKGLPLVKPGEAQTGQRTWIPNAALLMVLRESIYDPSPDEAARMDRWYSLTRTMCYFGVTAPKDYSALFAKYNIPLTLGADHHITNLISAYQDSSASCIVDTDLRKRSTK